MRRSSSGCRARSSRRTAAAARAAARASAITAVVVSTTGLPRASMPITSAATPSAVSTNPQPVQRVGPLGADVGHQPPSEHEARDAQRHVDQEDPPPRRVSAAAAPPTGRGDDGRDQRGPGEVGDRRDQLGLVGVVRSTTSRPTGTIIAPPMPCNTRVAVSIGRSTAAAQPTEASVNIAIAAEEHPPGAEPVGQPPADRDQHREGQQVGGDRDVDVDGRHAEVGRRCAGPRAR